MPKGTRGLTDINVCKCFFLFLGEREGKEQIPDGTKFHHADNSTRVLPDGRKVCHVRGTHRDHDHHGLISPFLPEQSFSLQEEEDSS